MDQIKTFKITGYIKKSGRRISFTRDIRALKKSDATEKIYAEIGSRHKAKRFDIKLTEIQESDGPKEPK